MTTVSLELSGLQTESRNNASKNIDRVATEELCRILNQEDAKVAHVVEKCIPVIASAIDSLSARVRSGGRVIYIGAGTSGRLGVLDASEIPPTYSAPEGQFVAIIAGGDDALRHAKEGAEDDRLAAENDLRALNLDHEIDSLIGIASSGRTPYVLSGLAYAKSIGCVTVGIACVEPSAMAQEGNADFMITAVTGAEVVTGSTRMKAGTGTKLLLNMISSGIMIKIGKTYGNMMIDVKATNLKLKQRAKNILRFIGDAKCTQSEEDLEALLGSCHGSVKLAAASIILQCSVAVAEDSLQRNGGVLSRVIEEAELVSQKLDRSEEIGKWVLCVDGGGSSCVAVILGEKGEQGVGESGSCNVSDLGVENSISTIDLAIQRAINSCPATQGRSITAIPWTRIWVGLAGYDRPAVAPLIDVGISKLLGLTKGERLRITSDIDLLPMDIADQQPLDSVIVLVAGTGSVAMRYQRVGNIFKRTARSGGWGHLLGDEGSGYNLGREALRVALASSDELRFQKWADKPQSPIDPLSRLVFGHFKELYPESREEDLLSSVLAPDADAYRGTDVATATTRRIASVSKVVMAAYDSNETAKSIVDAGAKSLVRLVASLLVNDSVDPSVSALVLAGGLMQNHIYQTTLKKTLIEKGIQFDHIQAVNQPALMGARFLARLGQELGVKA